MNTSIIGTIADLKRSSLAGHFFDRATMDFFNSRIESGIYRTGPRTGYFVTSEQFASDPREYTVRHYGPEFGITTVGHAMRLASRDEARDAARELSRADRATKTQ